MIAEGWQWVYQPPQGRECGSLALISPLGNCAASVYLNNQRGSGYNWYVRDKNGTGGENSTETTVDQCIAEAEAAVIRWGMIRD